MPWNRRSLMTVRGIVYALAGVVVLVAYLISRVRHG
jgi:hypothetical protein